MEEGVELVYLGSRFWLAGNVAWAWGKEKRADASQPCFLFPCWACKPGTGARGAGAPGNVGTSSRGLALIPSLPEVHIPQGLG